MTGDAEHWDAFVSHASEDKETFVRPLVEALGRLEVSLWYDEASLKLGDSLAGSINRGIAKSRCGIIVVSPAFLEKKWPEAELNALVGRRVEEAFRLLPVWHGVRKAEVAAVNPMLGDMFALRTAGLSAQDVALALLAEIRPDLYGARGRPELERLATGQAFEELETELAELREKVEEFLCPHCDAPLVDRFLAYDDRDPNQVDMEAFACGHVRGGHFPKACPHDSSFPVLTDYELRCEQTGEDSWVCFAAPKTAEAKRHHLSGKEGQSEREALNRMIESYNSGAPAERRVEIPRC